jgi:cyanate permease
MPRDPDTLGYLVALYVWGACGGVLSILLIRWGSGHWPTHPFHWTFPAVLAVIALVLYLVRHLRRRR